MGKDNLKDLAFSFQDCQTCGKKILGKPYGQIVKYCSKECRRKRRNKKVGNKKTDIGIGVIQDYSAKAIG